MRPQTCPACGYTRQLKDTAPEWQCPACQIAYNKANKPLKQEVDTCQTEAQLTSSSKVGFRRKKGNSQGRNKPSTVNFTAPKYRGIQRFLSIMLLTLSSMSGLAYIQKYAVIDSSQLLPSISNVPIQTTLKTPQSFQFDYKAITYTVEPVATYELWGLVVSHNDITGIGDIYHDETSVDTKDLCVVWGDNAQGNAYHGVEFSSGSWTCYFQYPWGSTFNPAHLSNNHLITTDPAIREVIDDIHIGDQIYIKGFLVNYQDTRHPDFWRKSSLSRDDSGNYACEVVFVEQLDVLKEGNPSWWLTFKVSVGALLLCLLLKVGIMLKEIFFDHVGNSVS